MSILYVFDATANSTYLPSNPCLSSLDALLEELVELANLSSDRQVDGAVAKVNVETTLNGRVDLVDVLELLSTGALGDV